MTSSVESAVPGRRVVEPGLPRMDHDRESGPGRSPGIEHVAVLGDQARIQPAQERHRRVRIVRVAVHLERRMGVDGRLRDPGRLDVARGVRRSGRRLPEGRTGKVGVLRDRWVEYDVGHHPVRPLCAEQRLELLLGARLVVPRAAERDERRVPAPLVRIEGAGRQAGGSDPRRVEHDSSPCDEVVQGRAISRSRPSPSDPRDSPRRDDTRPMPTHGSRPWRTEPHGSAGRPARP